MREEIEKVNLGNETSTKEIFIGKKLTTKVGSDLISLLRKYTRVCMYP